METYSLDHSYAAASRLTQPRITLDPAATFPHRDWLRTVANFDKPTKRWSIAVPSTTKGTSELLFELSRRGIGWR